VERVPRLRAVPPDARAHRRPQRRPRMSPLINSM
jgi:hypothetical protein